jgi:hypothetical protein
MSNVLIGIIGVILFIGLALAGALILGDDFRTAGTSSKAAAAVQQIQQIQSAVEMWRLKTGRQTVANGTTDFLVPRFLKVVPVNPTGAGIPYGNTYVWQPHFNNDIYPDQDNENGIGASYAMIAVGLSTDPRARAICQAVVDTYSGGGQIVVDGHPTAPVGCQDSGSQFVVYARI